MAHHVRCAPSLHTMRVWKKGTPHICASWVCRQRVPLHHPLPTSAHLAIQIFLSMMHFQVPAHMRLQKKEHTTESARLASAEKGRTQKGIFGDDSFSSRWMEECRRVLLYFVICTDTGSRCWPDQLEKDLRSSPQRSVRQT